MSTSMLEQALIDAEELREAAIKNAEQAIIEKYSIDIKKAVEVILEQEDELGELPADDSEAPEESNFQKEVPAAHTDDEELCACPDEDEEIEIDFDELAKRLDTEEEKMGTEDMTDREDFGDETLELQEDVLREILEETEDLDEEVEITEEALESLKEEDTVEESNAGKTTAKKARTEKKTMKDLDKDAKTRETDWSKKIKKESAEEPAREPTPLPTSRSDRKSAQAAMLDEYKKQMAESRRQNKKLNKQLLEVVTEHKEIKKLALKLKDKLNEINLSNLKLHYTNRILTSDSLNERQKNKIVEAIKRAVSVEETKTIFETLQSAVGDASAKVAPKSLNEVMNKRSSAFLPRKERPSKKDDSFAARMKTLAGIKE